jgi:ParB family transcriptional regulator, chromosome partitioning protein
MSLLKKGKTGGLGKGLGKKKGQGLSALIPNSKPLSPLEVSIKLLVADPKQPRRYFDLEQLQNLSDSIKVHGIIQPIVVMPLQEGHYQIIAGERRWRAAQIAKLSKVPILCKDVDELARVEIALLENIQRQDLTPIEEALAFERLMREFKLSHELIAGKTGKSRSSVSNALRLLKLPQFMQDLIDIGKLSSGHGRALLSIDNEEQQMQLLALIQEEDYSVRACEQWVTRMKNTVKSNTQTPQESNDILDTVREKSDLLIREQLSHNLNRKVQIKHGKRGGKLILNFSNDKDLKELSFLLSKAQV